MARSKPNWINAKQMRALRNALIERDGLSCRWCGSAVELPPSGVTALSDHHATIDHVRPRARGGGDDLRNLVLACNRCNQARSRQSGSAGLMTEQQLAALLY